MNEEFIRRTSLAWGMTPEQAVHALSQQYDASIRINPFRVRKSTLPMLKRQYASITKVDWVDNAYSIHNEQVRPSTLPEFSNGEFIIQNAASFIPVLQLNPQQGEDILDMCAAPGGKSSHIATLTINKANLVLNDTSRTRFFKMRKLMTSMGVQAEYSLRDGRYISKEYGNNSFDKILLDAPCSGEANLTADTAKGWSIATIKRLHSLQTRLIQEAFALLKPGGTLVYSTCTIAPEENELVIDYLLRHNPTATIVAPNSYPIKSIPCIINWNDKDLLPDVAHCIRLLPSVLCKPFFIATITKTTTSLDGDDSYERLLRSYK